MKQTTTAVLRLFSVMTLSLALILQAGPVQTASAAQITSRSLTLQAGSGGDGGSLASGEVNHLFGFTTGDGGSVGSVKFEYCTTAAAVPSGIDCDLPVGLDTTSVTLGAETGATGFSSVDNSTNGIVIISRASASAVAASLPVTYRIDNVTNPSTINETFFVRVSMHTSTDGTDPVPVDSGTVAASTAERIYLEGTMPESLVFCTGEEIPLGAGDVPDCANATPGVIAFDKLFSPTDTAKSSSQMAASTNAGFGYAITVNGPTLTSGSNTIAAMGTRDVSIPGTPQFGLNLVENIATAGATAGDPLGANVLNTGGTLYNGVVTADYAVAEEFKFVHTSGTGATNPGEAVATSPAGTDTQIYTVSYIANVPGSQPAGTYASTLTYICTPTF